VLELERWINESKAGSGVDQKDPRSRPSPQGHVLTAPAAPVDNVSPTILSENVKPVGTLMGMFGGGGGGGGGGGRGGRGGGGGVLEGGRRSLNQVMAEGKDGSNSRRVPHIAEQQPR
jgi:hypothetical protein